MREDPALPPTGTEPADAAPAASAVERRARALLVLLAALLLGAAGYLLHARGVFESTQTLVLVTDDAEGVVVGMDLTFSGFPIGRVRRIKLAPDGAVRIVVDVARRDAHWLREGSVFTMERGLVGGTRLRAYTGVLEGPLLPDGAERRVLRGDALADLPRAINTARELLEQLRAMSDADAPLNASLRELRALLAKANGEAGVLGVVMGSDADRSRVTAALDDTRRLLQQATAAAQRVEALVQRTDGVVQRTDERVLGPQGLADEVQATVLQARELLVGLRGTLQRVDAVLVEAHGIAANTRAATVDLDALRAEVEATLQRVDGMIVDIQRHWPFARESEVRLP